MEIPRLKLGTKVIVDDTFSIRKVMHVGREGVITGYPDDDNNYEVTFIQKNLLENRNRDEKVIYHRNLLKVIK